MGSAVSAVTNVASLGLFGKGPLGPGILSGGASAPTMPTIPIPPPAASPATIANPAVAATANNARARAAAAAGATSGTGPEGLSAPPQTAGLTLLGGSK